MQRNETKEEKPNVTGQKEHTQEVDDYKSDS